MPLTTMYPSKLKNNARRHTKDSSRTDITHRFFSNRIGIKVRVGSLEKIKMLSTYSKCFRFLKNHSELSSVRGEGEEHCVPRLLIAAFGRGMGEGISHP